MSWASYLGSEKVYHFSGSGGQAGLVCSRDSNKARETGGEEWSLSGDHVRESLSGPWRPSGRTGYFILFVVEATEGLWEGKYCELIHILKGSLSLNSKYGQWWLSRGGLLQWPYKKELHWHPLFIGGKKTPTCAVPGVLDKFALFDHLRSLPVSFLSTQKPRAHPNTGLTQVSVPPWSAQEQVFQNVFGIHL